MDDPREVEWRLSLDSTLKECLMRRILMSVGVVALTLTIALSPAQAAGGGPRGVNSGSRGGYAQGQQFNRGNYGSYGSYGTNSYCSPSYYGTGGYCTPSYCPPPVCQPVYCPPPVCQPVYCPPPICEPVYCPPPVCPSSYCPPTYCPPSYCAPSYCPPSYCSPSQSSYYARSHYSGQGSSYARSVSRQGGRR